MADTGHPAPPGTATSYLYLPGYYIFLAVFGIGSWLFNLSVMFTRGSGLADEARLRRRIQRLLCGYLVCLRRFCGMRLHYVGWPADWEQALAGSLVAANHSSLLDAPLILSRSSNIFCLYKNTLERTLLWPATARRAGYLSNLGGIDMIREASDKLRAGGTLLVFPEGTRSTDGRLGPLEAGTALIAQRAEAPVQTLVITLSSPLLTKDRSLLRPPRTPLTICLRWGERLMPRPEETAHAFKARLESSLRTALTSESSADCHDGHLLSSDR